MTYFTFAQVKYTLTLRNYLFTIQNTLLPSGIGQIPETILTLKYNYKTNQNFSKKDHSSNYRYKQNKLQKWKLEYKYKPNLFSLLKNAYLDA